jgi:hypothetical protein
MSWNKALDVGISARCTALSGPGVQVVIWHHCPLKPNSTNLAKLSSGYLCDLGWHKSIKLTKLTTELHSVFSGHSVHVFKHKQLHVLSLNPKLSTRQFMTMEERYKTSDKVLSDYIIDGLTNLNHDSDSED